MPPACQGTTSGVNAEASSGIEAGVTGTTSVLRTLVLSDLVDSTALVERLGDQRAAELFRKHDKVARALMQRHGGQEIDKTDGFLLVFERPIQAVAYALAYQRELAQLGAQEKIDLAARIGIHVGDIVVWDNSAADVQRGAKRTEVEGLVKPVAARLMGLALPRQILMSGTAYDIAHRAQGELGEALARVRWRTHGRYRFKGVPDLVPVFEVGEEDFAPLRAPTWSGKAHREMPVWRRPTAMVMEAIALLLLLAVPTWYLLKPAPAIAFANRDWVVVGDLKNLTGQKVFDESLQSAFRVGLEQSRYVNVVPQMQVRDSLKRMERDPIATAVDRTIGAEVAVREGARALVIPTVAEVGGHVRITAEIVDPNTQTTVYSDSVDAQGDEGLLPGMDDLLRKMRGRLGESLASVSEASRPLAQITTSNIDALRALGKAEEEYGRGKINDAIMLLKEALRLDSKFALAWVRLSTLQNAFLGDAKAAHASLQSALANRDRLSAREQLFLDGTVAQYEDADRWIEKWTVATQLYPDAVAAQQNLGIGYLWYQHQLDEAIPHFLAIANSRHPLRGLSWCALAVIETEKGNDSVAMSHIARARELSAVMPHFEDVAPDLAARRYAAATARLKAVSSSLPEALQAERQLKFAAIAVDQADDATAKSALEAAAQYADKSSSAPQRARVRLARAAFDNATGATGAAQQLVSLIDGEIMRLSEQDTTIDGSAPIHLALAAMLASRSGNFSKAKAALDASRANALNHGFYDRAALWRTADCEVRLAKEPTSRATCLAGLVDGREYYQTHVALHLAYKAAGADDKADEQAAWLRTHRGRATAELENEVALIPNLLDARLLSGARAPR
ncbi:putative peptide modification system cyclase [Dokdonella sp.]|uniref:putative peptide modification system cyclase n=1 Tax=Dokdonella sp. TaxID=2291710 RepID=UPI003782ED1C